MQIRYFDTLGRSITRMVNTLFKPFDLHKWLVLGFTAFLAHLYDSNTGLTSNWKENAQPIDFDKVINFPQIAWDWFLADPIRTIGISGGVFLIIILSVTFLWLSSRSKFMFLDNVAHNRALVKHPWNEYGHLGDSLFAWRLVFSVATVTVIILFMVYFFEKGYSLYEYNNWNVPWFFIIRTSLFLGILLLLIMFISNLLDAFVVPIMYHQNLYVMEAWGTFLDLFKQHVLKFIGYSLFVFILGVLVTMALATIGFMTCCIGFIFLAIPYIHSVVLLPVSVTFRGFSLEFLQQFGEEFIIFNDKVNEDSE